VNQDERFARPLPFEVQHSDIDPTVHGVNRIDLVPYTDADIGLTERLETDPVVMAELGGPVAAEKVPELHRRRLGDPWWFKVVALPGGEPLGTIGIWVHEIDGETIHETGWMILPEQQGRGYASAALAELIERARAEPRFETVHAFPGARNGPSNALCRKAGFEWVSERTFVFRGSELVCNHWRLVLGPAGVSVGRETDPNE
jgi:RimJ/RimL family protein N-acetyltransferase